MAPLRNIGVSFKGAWGTVTLVSTVRICHCGIQKIIIVFKAFKRFSADFSRFYWFFCFRWTDTIVPSLSSRRTDTCSRWNTHRRPSRRDPLRWVKISGNSRKNLFSSNFPTEKDKKQAGNVNFEKTSVKNCDSRIFWRNTQLFSSFGKKGEIYI